MNMRKSLVSITLTVALVCCNSANPVDHDQRFEAGPILFVSDKSGTWQLYSMNEDGSDVKQLTNDPNAPITEARWSPDGKKIVYVSYDSPDDIRWRALYLYVMSADGTGRYKLTNHPRNSQDTRPVWSPDGKRIAFSRLTGDVSGDYDIFVIDVDGRNEQRITRNQNLTELPASWTPDGLHLLVNYGDYSTGKQGIALLDLQGDYVQTLTPPDSSDRSPVLSPDGKLIVFTSRQSNLHLMDINGLNRRSLSKAVFLHFAVNFSMDGSRILYNAWDKPTPGVPFVNDPRNIVIIDTSGTKEVRITPFDYREGYFWATSWRRR